MGYQVIFALREMDFRILPASGFLRIGIIWVSLK
jgi:hypothetical protein